MSGVLSIVATPIGNLEDITLRALSILSQADYVLCEDTRVTGKLLFHHDIKVPLKRYNAHASQKFHETILADLSAGKKIVLVSDAGTPGISDPGVLLVARARSVGARIETVPGPSALTAAVSLAGIPGNQFTFLGFVPHKKGRETFFKSLPELIQPVIFFESTHRIMKTLEALRALEDKERSVQVTIARELTKLHEEVVQGSPAEVYDFFETQPIKQKGEFVVIFALE